MAWTFGRAKPHPAIVAAAPALDVRNIHDAHADFVWKSLLRLGETEADAEDVLQSVFMVVHRRLDTYDGSAKLTTWLFGICLRLAAGYRRKSSTRREETALALADERHEGPDPAEQLEEAQARVRLSAVLDTLDPEKRAVFVMFELDEMSCEEIAEIVGVPVGTVYSRLSAARKAFAAALARLAAKDAARAAGIRGGVR